jgi:hypothetical protein
MELLQPPYRFEFHVTNQILTPIAVSFEGARTSESD